MVEKLKVNGLAIKPGVSRNNIMYTKEELRKFANTLKGVSIIKDHNTVVDNAIGKVENVIFDEKTGEVLYEGWVKNDSTDIMEKIKDGRVQHVSIGALCGRVVKESEDSDVNIAEDIHGVELSTVVVPGVPGASINQSFDFKEEDVKQMILDYEKESVQESQTSDIKLNKMEEDMEKNDEQIVVQQDSRIVEFEAKVKALETANAEMKAKLDEYAAKERKALEEAYAKLCSEKNVKALDIAKMDSAVIESLMAQLSSIVVEAKAEVKTEAKVEAVKEEKKVTEEVKEEVKEIAMPKSEAKVEETAKSFTSRYMVEQSELGGSCLYRL